MNAQDKWNEKYRTAALSTPAEPAWVVRQHSRLLPLTGSALDLACGLGGNARFLARCGLRVEGWDISDAALSVLDEYARRFRLSITTRQVDLEQPDWPAAQFDVVVISRWLDRTAFEQVGKLVRPGGRLFWQTFLGPVQETGPHNPDYWLKSGELVAAYGHWRVEVHGEGYPEDENTRFAWLIAQKPT